MQAMLIQMKTYLKKLLLDWINSTIQYPASHRYTWIGMGILLWSTSSKSISLAQSAGLGVCASLQQGSIQGNPSPTSLATPPFPTTPVFPSFSTVTMCLYFLLFLLSLFTILICFYDFRSAGDSNKENFFEPLFFLNSSGSSSENEQLFLQ